MNAASHSINNGDLKESEPLLRGHGAGVGSPYEGRWGTMTELLNRWMRWHDVHDTSAGTKLELWGGASEPPYTDGVEDAASVVSRCTFSWIGDLIYQAAKEELTPQHLPPPTKAYRTWNVGLRMSHEFEEQRRLRHGWDRYVGCLVTHRKAPRGLERGDTRIGVLRWVGYSQRSTSPDVVMVGVEWDARPDWSGAVPHSGVVDGETLFLVSTVGMSTLERADSVTLLLPSRADWQRWQTLPHSATHRVVRDMMVTMEALQAESELPPPPTPKKPSAFRALLRVHRWILLKQVPFKAIGDYASLSFPVVLEYLVDFLAEDSPDWRYGVALIAIIGALNIVQTFCTQKYYHLSIQSGAAVRSSFLAVIFEKCFLIAPKAMAHPELGTGRVLNMVSTDVERANDFCWYAMYMWGAPQQLIIAVVLLYRLVGWCSLAGLSALLFTMPAQGWIARSQQKLRTSLSRVTDQRVKVTTELLSGIRIVKYMAWEQNFLERIHNIRREELTLLKSIQYYRILTSLINVATPTVVIATVLVVYHATGHHLTAQIVFPTIALLNITRISFGSIPVVFTAFVQLFVAMGRITRFVDCDDEQLGQIMNIDDYPRGVEVPPDGGAREGAMRLPTVCECAAILENVTLTAYVPVKLPALLGGMSGSEEGYVQSLCSRLKASCSCCLCCGRKQGPEAAGGPSPSPTAPPAASGSEFYELQSKDLLTGISLRIPKNALTVIVGPTGCGKSTLMESLLGQFEVTRGLIYAPRAAIAYVPQQAWIMNATVKDNITFFSEYEGEEFQRAVAACQLDADLASLIRGIDTEIGEKGVNLSGGQRARVGLARAVYARRQVYLLDDPLSALDPHVSERILEDCICGELRGTTRILCTHQMHVVTKADHIVVLAAGGTVAFAGSYEAYLAHFPSGPHDATVHSPLTTGGGSGMEFRADSRTMDSAQGSTVFVGTPVAVEGAVQTRDRGDAATEADEKAKGARSPRPAASGESRSSSGSDVGDVEDLLDEEDAAAIGEGGSSSADGAAKRSHRAVAGVQQDDAGKLMSAEEKAIGSVPWTTYLRYVRACGGVRTVVMILAIFACTELLTVSSSVWLSIWSVGRYGLTQDTYLYVFLGCVSLSTFASPLRYYSAYNAMRLGSLNMHQGVLYSVVSAPMSFFDTTPLGRIINRFARDIDQCDNDLQMSYLMMLQTGFSGLSTVGVMMSAQPFVLVAMVPCSFFYYRLMLFYNSANREIRRLSSILKSPMFAILTEALTGSRSVRAYGKCPYMMTEALKRLDVIYSASYMNNVANRWLGVRIEIIANIIITTVAAFAICGKLFQFGSSDVGLLSLGFTMSLSITQILNWIVRQVAAVESDMNSVERLVFYTDSIPHEDIPELTSQITMYQTSLGPLRRSQGTQFPDEVGAAGVLVPATAAPQGPVISYQAVQMRYRDGLPLVLRDLSFDIYPGEKVGVVGRTGSGKSTLLLTFLRIVDISGGAIQILGRPIRDYSILDLRGLYSMIPQDPLLFEGTIRSNVDPFQVFSTDDVLHVLRLVGLQARVEQEALGLMSPVLENGSNFSVGQRQLLCLARALLRKDCSFILMDEATANIDPVLDKLIQTTIKKYFAQYTVVTIAHRLHTVLEYDKILVMDQGRVVESGRPWDLAHDRDSHLRAMMASHGADMEAKLLKLVQHSKRHYEKAHPRRRGGE